MTILINQFIIFLMKEKLKKLPWIFLIAFALNLIWELSQMFLYVDMSDFPICCIKATFWDAVMISAVYLLMSRANPVTISVLMFLIAVFIEKRAMIEGRWIYTEAMPLLFGLGLSPLMQLPVTTLLTFHFAKKFSNRIR